MNALFTYFKESWNEMANVTWPTRSQSIRLTIQVIILAGIIGAFIGVVDFGMVEVLQQLITGA